jgi:hypothetical protein
MVNRGPVPQLLQLLPLRKNCDFFRDFDQHKTFIGAAFASHSLASFI